MFSPSELEGEVDHAFFDSDCDDGRRDGGKKVDIKLTTDKYISPSRQKIQSKPAADLKSDEDDSGEDVRYSCSKVKNRRSYKKQIKNGLCPSPVLSGAKKDTDSESSCGSDISSSGSETHSKPNNTSSSGDRRSRVGSATSGDGHSVCTDDSDDTVTDVSPLSSPDSSRLQSLDLNHSEVEQDSLKEPQQSVPSSGLSNAQQDENSSQEADDYSLNSESQLEAKVVMNFPGARHRKNYSFSNDEVQRIDRENQRLLRQLSRFSSESRPGSASGQRKRGMSNIPLNRLPHSALNRQREQQRIERENLAFLKRLESVKPTAGMKRSEQLADYQRQVGYSGMCPVYQTTTKKSSRVSSAGKDLRQSKAIHHSARAASTATELSSTPVPRSKKTSDWS